MWESDIVIYKKLIAAGCFKEPKYKAWFKRESWSVLEAACLFKGVDPYSSSQVKTEIHPINFPGIKTVITEMKLISYEDNKRYNLNNTELWMANEFLNDINREADAIANWKLLCHSPLLLTNAYLRYRRLELISKKLLKLAKELFWDLYQKRNNDFGLDKTHWRWYWKKISDPFLQVIAEKEYVLLKKDGSAFPETDKTFSEERIAKQDNKVDKEKIKIILEESAKAREKRVRNRGLEIYRDFKEKYPNKKITKEDVARQIMQEEAALYGFISKEQPLKKQPVLGTYLKELRRGL